MFNKLAIVVASHNQGEGVGLGFLKLLVKDTTGGSYILTEYKVGNDGRLIDQEGQTFDMVNYLEMYGSQWILCVYDASIPFIEYTEKIGFDQSIKFLFTGTVNIGNTSQNKNTAINDGYEIVSKEQSMYTIKLAKKISSDAQTFYKQLEENPIKNFQMDNKSLIKMSTWDDRNKDVMELIYSNYESEQGTLTIKSNDLLEQLISLNNRKWTIDFGLNTLEMINQSVV